MAKIEPMSAVLSFWAFGLALIAVGIATFAPTIMGYAIPILLIAAATIALVEIGLKKFTDMSALKELSYVEWITVGIAVFVVIFAFTMLPFIPFEAPTFIAQLASYGIIVLGFMTIVQAHA